MKLIATTIICFLFSLQVIHSNVVIINGLTHSFSGVSGQTFQGQIILANTSNEEQRVTFELNEAIYFIHNPDSNDTIKRALYRLKFNEHFSFFRGNL